MSEYIVRIPSGMPYEIKAELNAWYVNSEPVVRCKDCKHFERMNSDEGWCTVPDGDGGYAWWMVDNDGYCYLGIRSAGK